MAEERKRWQKGVGIFGLVFLVFGSSFLLVANQMTMNGGGEGEIVIEMMARPEEGVVMSGRGFPGAMNVFDSDSVIVTNAYERKLGRAIGDGLYPHHYLCDVAQTARFEFPSRKELVHWVIEGIHDSVGPVAEVNFPETGRYRMIVMDAITNEILLEDIVHVVVVRREIRELNETERNAYFSTLHTLYVVGDKEGKKMYGHKYYSAHWLIREHLYGGAQRDCDHWHDDAGIMNHHIGITWQLEEYMRVVDSTTAAHYWDYTLDGKLYGRHPTGWQKSPIFDDAWYGEANPSSETHVLDTGRWAYTPVKTEARSYSNITNPYGLLRSPWNTNKLPFVLRSEYVLGQLGGDFWMPTCTEFQSYLDNGNANLGELLAAMNGQLHGPVHILVGGHWGDNKPFWGKLTTKHDTLSMSQILLMAKFLWRQGYTRCPDLCSWDTPQHECMCECPGSIINNRSSYEILKVTGALDANMPFNSAWDLGTDGYLPYDDLLDAFCHVGFPGEMFTSAAPQDPIFWPLHGNAERFLQFVRLAAHEGWITLDETWDYAHESKVASDTGVVCNWDGVTGMDLPECVQETCPGHKLLDLLPFSNLPVKGMPEGTLYTNKEFYDNITTPGLSGLTNYVYNSLSYWPGCTDSIIIDFSR